MPDSNVSHRTYLTGNYVNSIALDLTTQQELIDITNSMRPETAAGYDELPMSILILFRYYRWSSYSYYQFIYFLGHCS